MSKALIIGCGDVGSRIAQLIGLDQCEAIVSSSTSQQTLLSQGFSAHCLNLDSVVSAFPKGLANAEELYYLVPPQKSGEHDERSKRLLAILPASIKRIVLISTTGVYGDHKGEWVDETTVVNPQTDRAKRRWDMEQQWTAFSDNNNAILSTLRVPGIYSHSRLPRARIEKLVPIVDPKECGFTNRIHADDLAAICLTVMQQQSHSDVYNATDGSPGKISEYLLAVADLLELPTPPIIPMADSEQSVSAGMLSYLRESRKISNSKLIKTFDIELKYPDFKQGIRF